MPVIRLRPGEGCQECGGQSGLPHLTLHDCLESLSQELADTLVRAHEISRARQKILTKHLDGLKRSLRKSDLSQRPRKGRQRR